MFDLCQVVLQMHRAVKLNRCDCFVLLLQAQEPVEIQLWIGNLLID